MDTDAVLAEYSGLPEAVEECPKCGACVDTTEAYAAIPGFPPAFHKLKQTYAGFTPKFEYHRESFESVIQNLQQEIKSKGVSSTLEQILNEAEWSQWCRQRLFYRSCTAFYRSIQLFFAYLVLERNRFLTWSEVTGYYSRFFFIQAFLNLLQCSWTELDQFVIFNDGSAIKSFPKKRLSPTLKESHSHEVWWQLMEAIKHPKDYPCDDLSFVLSRYAFNPHERNRINYDFRYLQGFIELDWFDTDVGQFHSHSFVPAREDHDITNIDRFFSGRNHENCDEGDFYGDKAQMIWTSLKAYMETLVALDFNQEFIKAEKIASLAKAHLGNQYSALLKGIVLSTSEVLKDGFDISKYHI